MSTVVVTQAHSLSVEDAKSRLSPFESDLTSKFGLKLVWSGDRAELKGTGASGHIEVNTSNVKATIKLSMMAKMAGIKPDLLEKSIAKRLKAALVDPPDAG